MSEYRLQVAVFARGGRGRSQVVGRSYSISVCPSVRHIRVLMSFLYILFRPNSVLQITHLQYTVQ